jgi:hypothetical protein
LWLGTVSLARESSTLSKPPASLPDVRFIVAGKLEISPESGFRSCPTKRSSFIGPGSTISLFSSSSVVVVERDPSDPVR